MELIVIAIFAIVFIGPQNLPHTLSKFAKFFVKARRYSSDIKVGFDDMVRKAESEMRLEEVQANLDQLKQASGIDGSSLKPLSSQQLSAPTGEDNDSAEGASAVSKEQQNSAAKSKEPAAEQDEDDALLFAGLPTHMGGRPVNPTFDNLDTAIEDERAAGQEVQGEAHRETKQETGQSAESQPSTGETAQPAPKPDPHEDEDHHEEMVKSLRDKLNPPSDKS